MSYIFLVALTNIRLFFPQNRARETPRRHSWHRLVSGAPLKSDKVYYSTFKVYFVFLWLASHINLPKTLWIDNAQASRTDRQSCEEDLRLQA